MWWERSSAKSYLYGARAGSPYRPLRADASGIISPKAQPESRASQAQGSAELGVSQVDIT